MLGRIKVDLTEDTEGARHGREQVKATGHVATCRFIEMA